MQAELSAENIWSDSIQVPAGRFNFSLWGTFSATISVQRTFDLGTTWLDAGEFIAKGEYYGTEGEGSTYRVGIKAGDYTSGTAKIRMGN